MAKTEFTQGGGAKVKLDRPKKITPTFSVTRAEGGWVFIKMTVDENFHVLTTEVSQPDTKPIIIERFKIEVGKYWGKLDEQTI
jgi:hypothetical protein